MATLKYKTTKADEAKIKRVSQEYLDKLNKLRPSPDKKAAVQKCMDANKTLDEFKYNQCIILALKALKK